MGIHRKRSEQPGERSSFCFTLGFFFLREKVHIDVLCWYKSSIRISPAVAAAAVVNDDDDAWLLYLALFFPPTSLELCKGALGNPWQFSRSYYIRLQWSWSTIGRNGGGSSCRGKGRRRKKVKKLIWCDTWNQDLSGNTVSKDIECHTRWRRKWEWDNIKKRERSKE